jgi:hypothetical protein
MINIHANGNRVSYGIKHYDLDTMDDLEKLKKKTLTPGTTAFIIDKSKYFMLNGKHEWVEINPYGMGSSNNSGGSEGNDGIYDGGSIDDSDPNSGNGNENDGIYDGGSIDDDADSVN